MSQTERTPERNRFLFNLRDLASSNSARITEIATAHNELLQPVNSACRTIVTIPAYKEFAYGQIQNMLTKLDNQSLPHSEYEIILLVNNPSLTRFPGEKAAKQDNENLIAYVRQQQAEGKLSNLQLIQCIDGELLPRHMGLTRGVANEVAALRFDETEVEEEGLIVQLDADLDVDHDFLANIREKYDGDPTLESTYIPRVPFPVDFVSDDLYMGFADEFLLNVYNHIASGFVLGTGPTFAFRAKLQRIPRFREYMTSGSHEDIMQGDAFAEVSKFAMLPTLRIYVADRIRPEGFESATRDFYIDPTKPIKHSRAILGLIGKVFSVKDEALALIPPNETWNALSLPDALRTVAETLAKISPPHANSLQSYMLEEVREAYTRLDPTKTDINNILSAALCFSLGRVALDIFSPSD